MLNKFRSYFLIFPLSWILGSLIWNTFNNSPEKIIDSLVILGIYYFLVSVLTYPDLRKHLKNP